MRVHGLAAILALPLTALLLSGCGGPALKRLTNETYPPKAPDAPLELFSGKATSGCLELAYLNSISLPDLRQLIWHMRLQWEIPDRRWRTKKLL